MTLGVSLGRTSYLFDFFKWLNFFICVCGIFGEKKKKKEKFKEIFLLIFGVSNLELSSPLKCIKGNFSPKRLVGTALEAQCNQWKTMYLFEYLVHYWVIANSSKSLILKVNVLLSCHSCHRKLFILSLLKFWLNYQD